MEDITTMVSTYAFFCDGASDGRALHLTLGVDNNTSVILEYAESGDVFIRVARSIPRSRGRHHLFGAMLFADG